MDRFKSPYEKLQCVFEMIATIEKGFHLLFGKQGLEPDQFLENFARVILYAKPTRLISNIT
jgi:hypothetical protein